MEDEIIEESDEEEDDDDDDDFAPSQPSEVQPNKRARRC